jgi:hypothetical protein
MIALGSVAAVILVLLAVASARPLMKMIGRLLSQSVVFAWR